MKVSKKRYIQAFGIIVIILALVRCAFPQIAQPLTKVDVDSTKVVGDSVKNANDSTSNHISSSHLGEVPVGRRGAVLHPIYSVPRYSVAFPDSQEVQLSSAQKWGVSPVLNRQDAEHRKSELTYVGASPYFCLDRLRTSIPYLVPRASILLNDIGRAFFDSLYVKGIPFHKFVITSVLRTKDDVARLQQHNGNATENSCHMYGTTIDISQNRYRTVQTAAHPRREVRNDTLKWVLAEVLRDFREANRCYVKYEVHQGCFHLTVR